LQEDSKKITGSQRGVQEVCKKLQEVCKKFVSSLQEVCKKFARILQEVCKNFARGFQGLQDEEKKQALGRSEIRLRGKYIIINEKGIGENNYNYNYVTEECTRHQEDLSRYQEDLSRYL
jgi:hypothetical protein